MGKKAKRPAIRVMDRDGFWKIIDWCRERSTGCEELADVLFEVLLTFEPEEIIAFDRQMDERTDEAYRYDLWAVAYIINGGCSDDGFYYFRGWLIAQGREVFEAALQDPRRVADAVAGDEECECEDVLYVTFHAYEDRTGKEMPVRRRKVPQEPRGQRWDYHDLPELYPELWRRFAGGEE